MSGKPLNVTSGVISLSGFQVRLMMALLPTEAFIVQYSFELTPSSGEVKLANVRFGFLYSAVQRIVPVFDDESLSLFQATFPIPVL